MGTKLGGSAIDALRLGSSPVSKLYLGDTEVWAPTDTPFSPPMENLLGWWSADTIQGLADGASVAQWNDRSSVGTHLIPVSAPTYVQNGANGLPVVRFNGSNQYLRSSRSGLGPTLTIVCAVRPNSLTGTGTVVGSGGMGGHQLRVAGGYPEVLKQSVVSIGVSSVAVSTARMNVLSSVVGRGLDKYKASASSNWDSANSAIQMVDGSLATGWHSQSGPQHWLILEPKVPTVATSLTWAKQANRLTYYPSDLKIQGSHDTAEWSDLATITGQVWPSAAGSVTWNFANFVAWKYYRVVTMSATGSGFFEGLEAYLNGDATTSSPAWVLRSDSIQTAAGATTTSVNGTGRFQIGARETSFEFWSGDMGEILVWTGQLDDTQLAYVEGYLKSKWT